jgi:hypothetical protein
MQWKESPELGPATPLPSPRRVTAQQAAELQGPGPPTHAPREHCNSIRPTWRPVPRAPRSLVRMTHWAAALRRSTTGRGCGMRAESQLNRSDTNECFQAAHPLSAIQGRLRSALHAPGRRRTCARLVACMLRFQYWTSPCPQT